MVSGPGRVRAGDVRKVLERQGQEEGHNWTKRTDGGGNTKGARGQGRGVWGTGKQEKTGAS